MWGSDYTMETLVPAGESRKVYPGGSINRVREVVLMRLSVFSCLRSRVCVLLAMPCLALAPVVHAAPVSNSGGPPVLDIGDQRQVFIDDRFFAAAHGVELVMHPPRKTGERTLVPDRPWERGGIGTNSSVIKDGDTYHMWYPAHRGYCYARSKDGIHWEKPNLGLTEYKGSRENNIVLGAGANGVDDISTEGMVFLDPTAPADERFRCASRISDEMKDTFVWSSPDGIHWRMTHKNVLTFNHPEGRQYLDSQNVIFWDDRISKYVAYMRYNWFMKGFRGRAIARSESDRLGGFLEVQDAPVVLGPDGLDAALGDMPVVDFYSSACVKYPWAQDAYYMFPAAYFHYIDKALAEFPTVCPVNAGPLHSQFAASRDGITWHRFDRRPFVDLGMKGDFDSMGARVFYGLVPSVDGREMFVYYLGTDHLHGWSRRKPSEEELKQREKETDPAKLAEWKKEDDRRELNYRLLTEAGLAPIEDTSLISRLVLRRDGFVSARADYVGGEFMTPPLKFTGRELVLNVDTSATGLARCELLTSNHQPIEGFRLADCDVIHTANDINRVVRWKGKSDVSSLAGKTVRLRVVYRDADLYAFQFRN